MKNNIYKVLALKYRPKNFKELIGQDIMIETITNSIKLNKLPNAYLLTGIQGVGKTTTARLIAKAINCNKNFIDPSLSQIIHNLAGLLTYIFVPISLVIVGMGLRHSPSHNRLPVIAITCGIVSSLFVSLSLSDLSSQYVGLLQRIIESIFLIWIVSFI